MLPLQDDVMASAHTASTFQMPLSFSLIQEPLNQQQGGNWAADDVINFLLILGATRFRLETLIVLDSFQVFILWESAGVCGTARNFGGFSDLDLIQRPESCNHRKSQHLLDVRLCGGGQR